MNLRQPSRTERLSGANFRRSNRKDEKRSKSSPLLYEGVFVYYFFLEQRLSLTYLILLLYLY
ncbi:MAG: hypothetical protein A4E53_02767 [Pelotomaculum sp. PtaB.Bin104]|nr:MAG: hypothetical protein A4E53_02767 [Pelotomaculum sp. PtaB.Bin104]